MKPTIRKVVMIFEGDTAEIGQAWPECCDIIKGHGLEIIDVIIETEQTERGRFLN